MSNRIFILDQGGLRNVSRKLRSYEFSSTTDTLDRALPTHTKVELNVRPSVYSPSVIVYVEPTAKARADFIRLCRIANNVPDNCVVVAQDDHEQIAVYRTFAAADASGMPYLSLEEIVG